jgi:dephospho-CoA kinase
VNEAGLEPTDTNFGATANRLRAEGGMDAIANLCIPEIRKQSAPLVLIDGIRGDAEVALFRHHFPGFILVAIDSSFDNRLTRIAARARSDDFTSADSLRNRDEREQRWGLLNALNSADLHIRNEGTLEEFSSAVHALLDRIGGAP